MWEITAYKGKKVVKEYLPKEHFHCPPMKKGVQGLLRGCSSLLTVYISVLQISQQASILLTHPLSIEPPFSVSASLNFYLLNSINISPSQQGGRPAPTK